MLDVDFAGRTLVEISPADLPLRIGQFRAHDYFGDGSYFLLDTPGHCVGHIAGLARVTADPPTFVFMAGDLNHHASEMRPNALLPYPARFGEGALGALPQKMRLPAPCPGSFFDVLNSARGIEVGQPSTRPNLGVDRDLAKQTIRDAMPFDADEDVLYVFAHDAHVAEVVELWPKGSLNDWKEKGWGEKLMWLFLEDFAEPLKRLKEKEGGKL